MSRSAGRAAIWLLVLLALIIVVAAVGSLLMLRTPPTGSAPVGSASPPGAAGETPRAAPKVSPRGGSTPTESPGEPGTTVEDSVRLGQAVGGSGGSGPTAGEPPATTRFFELPPPGEAIFLSEVVDAALHAPTVGERSNAATWLGRQGDLTQLSVLEKVQISDVNPQVRKAAARAADQLRRRFADRPWPSIPPGNPAEYLNK